MSGNNGPDDTGETSAQLRDARLTRALDHAPDVLEPVQPAAQRRDAILRAAHAAVQPPLVRPAVPRGRGVWAKLWDRVMGPGRMPWNAALVTVLLASFITLLWRNEPLPSAKTDPPIPAPSVPAHQERVSAAKAAPPVAAVQAPASPVTDDAAELQTLGRAANRAQAPRVPMATPAESEVPAESAALSTVPSLPSRVASDQPTAEMSSPTPPRATAPPAAAPARARQGKSILEERASSVPIAAALPQDWTDLRNGQGEVVARASAGDLPRLLALLQDGQDGRPAVGRQTESLGSAAGEAKVVTEPATRLDLLRAGQLLGSLELSGRHWQFVPRSGSGLTASQGLLGEAEAQALQAAMQRLGR